MKPETVVIYPSLGVGHLLPAVQLAKLFLHENLSVTIVLLDDSSLDSLISSVDPQISFHRLPNPQAHDPPLIHPVSLLFHHIHLSNRPLSDFLSALSLTSTIRALVLDMFCTSALDVATTLSIPSYFFFSSSAFCLSTFLTIPSLQSVHPNFLLLGDTPLHVPGLPPIPASHMPSHMHDRDGEVNTVLVSNFIRLPDADGILINSFEELEARAVSALVLRGMCNCPVYCIGPLIGDRREEGGGEHECVKWLGEQPKGSVVFLCFGSMGSLSKEQLKEIAIGLEKSGQRFLWVVKTPASDDPKKRYEARPEPDLDMLMPEGFVERTGGRGMVAKSWAPQMEVLKHGSVGGFVTHCGWNSILEAVSCGVAMIAWPLYAEQRMNKVVLVEEMRLAVGVEGYAEGMVSGEEVERKVRWLMESEGGRELKERAAAMKEAAVKARDEGGSSDLRWREFVSLLMNA